MIVEIAGRKYTGRMTVDYLHAVQGYVRETNPRMAAGMDFVLRYLSENLKDSAEELEEDERLRIRDEKWAEFMRGNYPAQKKLIDSVRFVESAS
jgi:hypothetical protein